MPTAQDLLNVAEQELGYKNKASLTGIQDKNANVTYTTNGPSKFTKYGLETFRNPRGDWCAYFVTWCFQQLGARQTLIYGGSAAVSGFLNAFRRNGQTVPASQAQPGDLFIIPGRHIGIVKQPLGNGRFISIEGNAGGPPRQVTSLRRSFSGYVVCRPAYDSNSVFIPQIEQGPILDSSANFKLANVMLKNDAGKLVGQLATGVNNKNCIRIRAWDTESKKVRQIKNVVKTDALGNPQWVSRRLKELTPNSGYTRKVLAGAYRLDAPFDFNFGTAYPFKIDLSLNVYRPSGYTGIINLVSNYSAGTNIGWQLYIDENNYLTLYYRSSKSDNSVKKVVFEDFNFNLSVKAYQEVGEYYNKETGELEWKNKDGSPKEGYPKTYWMGRNFYHIVIEKLPKTNNVTLTVNDKQYTMKEFYTHSFYSSWITSGTRTMVVGAYAPHPDYPDNLAKVVPITFISGNIDIEGVKNKSLVSSRFFANTNATTIQNNSITLKSAKS